MLTLTMHVAPASTLPPVKAMDVDPATAVTTPPQVFVTPGTAATASPVRASVNPTPVKFMKVLPFVLTVNVNVMAPPIATVAPPKTWEIEGEGSAAAGRAARIASTARRQPGV